MNTYRNIAIGLVVLLTVALIFLISIKGNILDRVAQLEPSSQIPKLAFFLGMEYGGVIVLVFMLLVSCLLLIKHTSKNT